jgi:hypothetical protein
MDKGFSAKSWTSLGHVKFDRQPRTYYKRRKLYVCVFFLRRAAVNTTDHDLTLKNFSSKAITCDSLTSLSNSPTNQ